MARIAGTDTIQDSIFKMSGGNPGAVRVLIDLIKQAKEIDPNLIMGDIWYILMLDTFKIYEHRIWMLFKDVCKEKLTHTCALIRACQLNIITETSLNHAIDNYGEGIELNLVLEKVKERIPEFITNMENDRKFP